jgi:adenylate cyclase
VTADHICTVDWDTASITGPQGTSTLRLQTAAVLRLLADMQGNVVSKDKIMSTVWPGIAVTDDSLVQCVAEIRKALGDIDHVLVKTIPKRGYLLQADALRSMANDVAPSVGMSVPDKSIAVLPFVNMSAESENNYFADGLTEDLITDLSNVKGFFVIARNSSFAYKGQARDVRDIARQLGVRHIIEGSVRKSANTVRINAQLIDCAAGGSHIWAERFDRDLADIFAVQDEVTRSVVEAIAGKLNVPSINERQRPKDMKAYDLFLRGRNIAIISKSECERGRGILEEALRLEPDYAAAHAELARTRTCEWLFWGKPEYPSRSLGDFHVRRAIELASRDAEILGIHGWISSTFGNYDEAYKSLRAALTTNQNEANAWMYLADLHTLTGNTAEGADACAKALRLNPHPAPWYYMVIGSTYVFSQKYETAIELLEPIAENYAVTRRFLAVAYAKLGRREESLRQAGLFMKFDPNWRASTAMAKRAFKFQKDRDWWREAYVEAGLPA